MAFRRGLNLASKAISHLWWEQPTPTSADAKGKPAGPPLQFRFSKGWGHKRYAVSLVAPEIVFPKADR